MELVIPDPLCPSISSSEVYQNKIYRNNSDDYEVKLDINLESSDYDRHGDRDGSRGRVRDRDSDGGSSMVLTEMDVDVESCSDVESLLLEHTHDCNSHANKDTDKQTVTDIARDTASTDNADRRKQEQGQGQGQRQEQGQEQGQGSDQPLGAEESTRYESDTDSDSDTDTKGVCKPDKSPHTQPQPHPHPQSQSQSRAFGDKDAMRRLGDWLREQEVSDDALSLLQQDGWMR